MQTSKQKTRLNVAAATVLAVIGLASAATSANAAVTLVDGQQSCDLYSSTGCKFSWSGGSSFDDPAQIVAAYNAAHNPTPSPQDLPALTVLGKAEENPIFWDFTDTSWTFINLPFDVSYYSVKTGGSNFLLFGLAEPTDTFTAYNHVIRNNQGQLRDISHVTFFGAPTGAVPEPATWAMMIGGFFGIGSALRRRPALRLATAKA